MKERLIIQDFGPIRNIDLVLSEFNILIGEQATGKSTIAKLLAVCRYFSYIVTNQGVFDYPVENKFFEGLTAWGLNDAIKPTSYIRYESRHYILTAQHHKFKTVEKDENGEAFEYEEILFLPVLDNYSNEFDNLLTELEKIKPKSDSGTYGFHDLLWTIPTSFFQNDVAPVLDNPFYLPTERGLQSIFSLGKNTIPNINDSLFNQFARLDQIAKLYKHETEIEPLDVIYKNVAGQGYVRKKHEVDFYSLANGASGYQSAIPIVLTIKSYSETRRKSKTFIVEEPELNLFPSAQYKLVQFLVDRCVNYGHAMLLTTHSPYILTSTNNLMYAFQVGSKHESEAEKIIRNRFWLNPATVSAYRLLSNGTCENIMDLELNQIKAEKIDEISRELNSQFDGLQDLELRVS